MKIIFDSEEQKEMFLRKITYFCPSEFGLMDLVVDDCSDADCSICWANAVKMEVKSE